MAGDLILAVEILEGRVPRQLARLVPARDQAPAPRRRAAPPGARPPRSTDTREPPSASRAPARDRNPPRSRCSAACPGDRTQAPRPRRPGNAEPSASHLADAQSQPDSRLALQQALRDNLPNRSASLTLIRTCSFPKIQPSKSNRTNPPCCRKRGHFYFGLTNPNGELPEVIDP